MKEYLHPALCLLVAWLASATASAAAFLPLQDRGNTTFDPNTSLEWLDLAFTAGQSYNTVRNGWNGYTTSQGFRFATRQEVTQLFLDAGANGTWAGPADPANLQPATLTLSLLGTTGSYPGSYSKSWMFYDPATEPALPTSSYAPSAVFGWSMNGNTQEGFFSVPGLSALTDYSSPELASALVRTIPEPSTSVLVFAWLALDLLAMKGTKHRRNVPRPLFVWRSDLKVPNANCWGKVQDL